MTLITPQAVKKPSRHVRTKEEFQLVLTFPDETEGRAYVRTEFHNIGGRVFPKDIIRQGGEEPTPTWPHNEAELIASNLRALFPQVTVELKEVK